MKPWEKYGSSQPSGPWAKYQENASASPVSEPKQAYSDPFGPTKNALRGTIPGMGLKAFEGVQNIFNKGGEAVAEGLAEGSTMMGNIPATPIPLFRSTPGKNMVNPNVAAGIGGIIQNAPDIASTVLMPEMAGVSKSATGMARRALGFSRGMLKTPFARGQATKAAETALEKGIIGASPQSMFDKASGLAAKSGEKIKSILKDVPADFNKAASDLESLRGSLTSGTREGTLATANSAIDDVQRSIQELSSQSPSLTKGVSGLGEKSVSVLNKLKNRVGKSINYLADLASQGDNKAIQNTLANSIRDMVKKVISPEEFIKYLEDQRLYSAAELMKKGLNNEIAGQMGNAAVSLPGLVAGAATGNAPQAIAATGLFEAGKRAGAGVTANLLQGAYKQTPRIGYAASRVGQTIAKNKPKKVIQNGHVYVLNEKTGEYE